MQQIISLVSKEKLAVCLKLKEKILEFDFCCDKMDRYSSHEYMSQFAVFSNIFFYSDVKFSEKNLALTYLQITGTGQLPPSCLPPG